MSKNIKKDEATSVNDLTKPVNVEKVEKNEIKKDEVKKDEVEKDEVEKNEVKKDEVKKDEDEVEIDTEDNNEDGNKDENQDEDDTNYDDTEDDINVNMTESIGDSNSESISSESSESNISDVISDSSLDSDIDVDEEDDSDISDDDSDISDDDSSNSSKSSESNYYVKDIIFGNMIYKNILYEQTFSKIFNLLEFTRENRGINQKHVDDIYNHYLNNPYQFIKPLDIICFTNDDMTTDHFYIADGQHRFEALKKLYEVNNMDKILLYFIHDAASEEEIRDKIKYLNSSNPVTSIYSFEKIPDLLKKIESKFTNIFSENKNHNADKMNQIKLRDHIEEIKLIGNTGLSVDEIFNYLLDFVQVVKDDYLKRTTKPSGEKKLFDKIASTHRFYPLIYRDYTWLNEFYNFIIEKISPKDGEVLDEEGGVDSIVKNIIKDVKNELKADDRDVELDEEEISEKKEDEKNEKDEKDKKDEVEKDEVLELYKS
jgi:hypothetical protein